MAAFKLRNSIKHILELQKNLVEDAEEEDDDGHKVLRL